MNTKSENSYKKTLISDLKKVFGIEVDETALKSVLSPDELMQIINEYSPKDFSLGDNSTPEHESFFKNVVDGSFRITLHNHTNFSDGRMEPEELIHQAATYADKVAKTLNKKDTRPPFILALTDHDEIKGSQEIIKLIAQNPEKYKNLKFVAGAELGAKLDGYYFDITALCINPFDKNLNAFVDNQKAERTKTANEFIKKVNDLIGSNYNLNEFEKLGFNNKKCLTNKSGLVYLEHCKKIIFTDIREKHGESSKLEQLVKNLYVENNYMNCDIPDAKDVIREIKQNNGLCALTHPIRTFIKENDLTWHKNFVESLHDLGINGIEAYQQYTYDQLKKFSLYKEKTELYKNLAAKYNLFLCGGTDSHEHNIFGHHHIINESLLEKFLT